MKSITLVFALTFLLFLQEFDQYGISIESGKWSRALDQKGDIRAREWTSIIRNGLADNGTKCVIAFKSIHKREGYATASGRCKINGCSASYFCKISKSPAGDYRVQNYLDVDVKRRGKIVHPKGEKAKNPLTGVNRLDKQKELQIEGVYKTYIKDKAEILTNNEEIIPPTIKAYTKALHEANMKARKHYDIFQWLYIQSTTYSEALKPAKSENLVQHLSGYVQQLSRLPFRLLLCCEIQLRLAALELKEKKN